MIQVRDSFLDSDSFHFQVNHQGVVQLSFGPTHVCMSVDAVYDLQYRLATFLAQMELQEYPEKAQGEEKGIAQGREYLQNLVSFPDVGRSRR